MAKRHVLIKKSVFYFLVIAPMSEKLPHSEPLNSLKLAVARADHLIEIVHYALLDRSADMIVDQLADLVTLHYIPLTEHHAIAEATLEIDGPWRPKELARVEKNLVAATESMLIAAATCFKPCAFYLRQIQAMQCTNSMRDYSGSASTQPVRLQA